jgi:hypothetical protein
VKRLVNGEVENVDAGLPVTQSDDPLSGGHFAFGTSKPPPGTAREGGRIIVHIVVTFQMANCKHTRCSVGRESPISNGSTTVGGAKTRFLFR